MILIKDWGPMALGKTCRYCTPCELIICHQDELEAELVLNLERIDPDVIGNPYHVFGTMDKKVWKDSLAAGGRPFDDALALVADFAEHLTLEYDPGGYKPADG